MKKEFIHIAFKNIVRHWRKSLITGICISLGFTGIILLGGYMIRMERYLTTQGIYLNHVGHLAIYKKNGLERHLVEPQNYGFSLQEQKIISGKLLARKKVEHVGHFIHGQGLITNGCNSFPFLVWASEAKTESYLRNHPLVRERVPLLAKLKKGQGFWESQRPGIVVTKRLAELLQKPMIAGEAKEKSEAQNSLIENCSDATSQELTKSHSGVQLLGNSFDGGLAAIDTNILGHYSTGFALSEDSSILMPLPLAQDFFGTELVTSISVFLKDEVATQSTIRWLRKNMKKWHMDFDIYGYQDPLVNPFYVGAMRFVYIMNLFFFIIVCGVVILSLLNAIQIAILERKSEIGTLLAVGYRRSHIRNLFEIESLVLASFSIFIGVIISIVLANFVNFLAIPFDIVGNADKLFLILEVEWWFCTILIFFFGLLVYAATSIICRIHLNRPVMKLLERID